MKLWVGRCDDGTEEGLEKETVRMISLGDTERKSNFAIFDSTSIASKVVVKFDTTTTFSGGSNFLILQRRESST